MYMFAPLKRSLDTPLRLTTPRKTTFCFEMNAESTKTKKLNNIYHANMINILVVD